MFKDDPDLECVYFGDTGDAYPHMMEFAIETCKKFKVPLKIIKAEMSQKEYHDKFGLPSDMIPIVRTPEAMPIRKESGEQKIQSFVQCCAEMLWLPIYNASLGKTVYRGIKKSDEHRTMGGDKITDKNGITWVNPIYDWTDDDVFDYLKKHNVEPARHYKQVNVSLDCVRCTAHTHSPTAVDRLRWTKENYPSYWPEIVSRFKKVDEAVKAEKKLIDEPFDFVLN